MTLFYWIGGMAILTLILVIAAIWIDSWNRGRGRDDDDEG